MKSFTFNQNVLTKNNSTLLKYFVLLIMLLGILSECKKNDTIGIKIVYMWEFDNYPDSENFQCQGTFSGTQCLQALRVVKRENGIVDNDYVGLKCCFRCELGYSWCLNRRNAWPGKIVKITEIPGGTWEAYSNLGWCDIINTEICKQGWQLNEVPEFREYLDWLIREYGSNYDLKPENVRLWGSNEDPPVNEGRTEIANVGCVENVPPSHPDLKYEIRIYCQALRDHKVSLIYHVLAHEFYHMLQFQMYGCDVSFPEQDAEDFAEEIAPLVCE